MIRNYKLIMIVFMIINFSFTYDSRSFFEEVNLNKVDAIILFRNCTEESTDDFQKKYGEFYISNHDAIVALKNLLGEKVTRPKDYSLSRYKLTFYADNNFHYLGDYDLKGEILFSNEFYKLSRIDLEKLDKNFIPLESFRIQFRNIPDFRKGVNLLRKNGFISEELNLMIGSPLFDYKGITIIKTKNSVFKNDDFEYYQKKLNTLIKNQDNKFQLWQSIYNSGADSIIFQILSNEKIDNIIPKSFRIVKSYNDELDDEPFKVYAIKNISLPEIFEMNNLSYSIKE